VPTCQLGLTLCGTTCTDTDFDESHCGACNSPCDPGSICNGGVCEVSCKTDFATCDGICTDTKNHDLHCGECDNACEPGYLCSGGACKLSCQSGLTDCNGVCTNTQTSYQHCGGCNNPCGTGLVCQAGSCTATCTTPNVKCGNICTNTQNDPMNCGGCGQPCGVGQGCFNGVCKGACTPGATELCYTGPANTLGVGPCKSGTKTCNALGTGWGPCTGEVLPSPEICGDAIDQNCNGVVGTAVFTEPFANNSAGWTLGTEWQIGAAVASGSCSFGNDPGTDHTPTADNGIAGVIIGGCYTTAIHGDYCLTSPNLNISGISGSAYFSYWRWLGTDYPPFMTSKIEVSSNGGTSWTQIWTAAPIDGAWVYQSFDVTAQKSTTFRVRFCHAVTGSGAINGAGWNIDDVRIMNDTCQ
jgi:hypothetical protein